MAMKSAILFAWVFKFVPFSYRFPSIVFFSLLNGRLDAFFFSFLSWKQFLLFTVT